MAWRALELDGEVLLFDRSTGHQLLVANPATRSLKRTAPRVIQVALTNACDKSCAFCYRPLSARSRWTFDGILELARFLDEWGVLELAFGGGEPTLFPRFPELLHAIWSETRLCPSFTTHGGHLTPEFLRANPRRVRAAPGLGVRRGRHHREFIALMVREGARFGLNYLVTPARVRTLEADVMTFVARRRSRRAVPVVQGRRSEAASVATRMRAVRREPREAPRPVRPSMCAQGRCLLGLAPGAHAAACSTAPTAVRTSTSCR